MSPGHARALEENVSLLQDRDRDSYELEAPYRSTRIQLPAYGTEEADLHTCKQSTRRRWALTWGLVVLAIITLTDLLTLVYMSHIMATVYADVGTADLEFANPYYGLAELYNSGIVNASRIDPILNTPRVVAQVFADRPDERAPVGEHDVFIKVFGTLSPHEKHLHVSQNVHTIAQFRTIDFGMEDCALVIRLPGANDRIESTEPFRLSPHATFDVFRLDAPKPLDVRALSYATRPRVREKVATVTPRAGAETQVARYACAWSTLHTFEIACAPGGEAEAGADCLVDVWSSQNTTWGVYMYQHQTI